MQKLKFILNNFYLLLILVDSYRCSELYKKTPRTNQNLVNKNFYFFVSDIFRTISTTLSKTHFVTFTAFKTNSMKLPILPAFSSSWPP